MKNDRRFRGERFWIDGSWQAAEITVSGSKIVAIDRPTADRSGPVEDFGAATVLPGLVDPHVHINDPGRDWEGFETATRAAAAGGVTTLVDMPLNSSPVTTTVAALKRKVEVLRGRSRVDVGLWGGVVPGNHAELEPLLDAGVLGFKAFLVDSGIDEFLPVSRADLEWAMPILARRGAVLLAHAELPGPIEHVQAEITGRDSRRYANYLASRPPEAELEAIALLIELCETTGCAVHIVHLATHEALTMLEDARRKGLPISVETCPHYLTFSAEEIADRKTEFKCAPPIRDAMNREALWQGLRDGTIDLIASDHSPCTPDLKKQQGGDFFAAWGGIASLQLNLPATWTEARRRGCESCDLGRWLSQEPARLAGLCGRKGAIAVGCDADFVVCDLDASFTVRAKNLYHRHALTPYAGRTLFGVVEQTWLRGQRIYDRGQLTSEPAGAWLQARCS